MLNVNLAALFVFRKLYNNICQFILIAALRYMWVIFISLTLELAEVRCSSWQYQWKSVSEAALELRQT